MNKSTNIYFAIYGFTFLVTSYLLIPSIQGTTPAYLLSFFGLGLFFIIYKEQRLKLIKNILYIFGGFIFLYILSQLLLMINPNLDFSDVKLVSENGDFTFRNSHFTQSLYIFAGISCFLIIKFFYNEEKHEKYFKYGIIFISVFGLLEVLFYNFFNLKIDIITNRTFENTSGSLFQTANGMLRLKSLTGEPSMYSFAILPFFIYFSNKKMYKLSLLLFITLSLTMSTTALLGFFLLILMNIKSIVNKVISYKKILLAISIILLLLIIIKFDTFNYLTNSMIIDKITQQNESGSQRTGYFLQHMRFFGDLPFYNQLFGVGFGTVRSTDFFSTLLVNCGYVGYLLFSALFAYPLCSNNLSNYVKQALIVIYVTMMVSVPEFAYLSIWFFLGLAYKKISPIKLGNLNLNIPVKLNRK